MKDVDRQAAILLDEGIWAQKMWARYDPGNTGFIWPTDPESVQEVVDALSRCPCGECVRELPNAPSYGASGWTL